MKQFDKIKEDMVACESTVEMAGYLDGINVAAFLYCKQNCPDEVFITENGENKVSILVMSAFLESEV